jgi:inner membrane protein
MDNLTHTLTGLMLSRAGLNRFTPHASLLLMLAANMPDIDVLSGLAGPVAYLDHHRGHTHAIAFTPLLALLPPLIVGGLFRRKIPWVRAWAISLAGVASHWLMDWTNVYGVRLWKPFSSTWLRLDLTFIIDLWMLAALFLALAAPFLSRLVNSEIGSRGSPPGRGWAWFALLFILLWNVGRFVAHERAIQVLNSRLYAGETPQRVTAIPTAITPTLWRGVVETRSGVHLLNVNLLLDFDPEAGRVYESATGPAVEAASRDPLFAGFLRFNRTPLWRAVSAPDPPGATQVELLDLRFGTPDEPGFIATALVLRDGSVEQARFSFRGRPR